MLDTRNTLKTGTSGSSSLRWQGGDASTGHRHQPGSLQGFHQSKVGLFNLRYPDHIYMHDAIFSSKTLIGKMTQSEGSLAFNQTRQDRMCKWGVLNKH